MIASERRLGPAMSNQPRYSSEDIVVWFILNGAACAVVPGNAVKSTDGSLGSFELAGSQYTIIKVGEEKGSDLLDLLTQRELDIALLVAAGRESKDIARRLRISYHTVRVHLGRIYAKLGLHKQTELAGLVSMRYGAPRSVLLPIPALRADMEEVV